MLTSCSANRASNQFFYLAYITAHPTNPTPCSKNHWKNWIITATNFNKKKYGTFFLNNRKKHDLKSLQYR